MTSFESNQSNAFDFDSIRMEIWQPDIIVLPIPENKSGTVTSVQSGIYITNNTRNSFRFNPAETITPELMSPDGQVLQRFLATNESAARVQTNTLSSPSFRFKLTRFLSNLTTLFKRSDYLLVEAGDTRAIDINIRLFWHNNQLIVEFNITEFSFISPSTYWLFDALELEKYQLRFIYLHNHTDRTNSNSIKVRTTQETESNQLATPFVNIQLVQAVGSNSNAIEVDNIRFETVVLEQLLMIPDKISKQETSFQIGMRVTNNTSTSFRFDFFTTLIPELLTVDGRALHRSYCCPRLESSRKSDYQLAMPSESIIHFQDAKIFWFKGDELRLQITSRDGCFCIFHNLIPSIYQIRFLYRKNNVAETKAAPKAIEKKSLVWVYKNIVPTHFVEFSLVSSRN